MMTLEGKLKAKIKADLKARGAYFFMPVQSGYGSTTLDILVCLRGLFIAIETKAEGKVPTARQDACIDQINIAGGFAFWCDTYDMYLECMRELERRFLK